jgi:hypothetical protein
MVTYADILEASQQALLDSENTREEAIGGTVVLTEESFEELREDIPEADAGSEESEFGSVNSMDIRTGDRDVYIAGDNEYEIG